MEDQLFDLDDFVIATKSNPRVAVPTVAEEKVIAKPEFNVKVDFKKRHISFDTLIVKEINLANNSLAHARSKTGMLAIIVVPGNQGVFGKQVANSKSKGSSFKNRVLIQDLVDLNLTSGKYNLEKIKTGPANVGTEMVENCDWYLLKMIGEPQVIDLTEKEEITQTEVPVEIVENDAPEVLEQEVEVSSEKF